MGGLGSILMGRCGRVDRRGTEAQQRPQETATQQLRQPQSGWLGEVVAFGVCLSTVRVLLSC